MKRLEIVLVMKNVFQMVMQTTRAGISKLQNECVGFTHTNLLIRNIIRYNNGIIILI